MVNKQINVKQQKDYLPEIVERQLNKNKKDFFIETGFTELDKITGGFLNSEYIVVAGTPGTGKTAFALNIAENLSMAQGKSTLVFSLEMTGEQLTERSIASVGEIDKTKLRKRVLQKGDFDQFNNALSKINESQMYICDEVLTVYEIKTITKRMMRKHDIKCVVVDYLQKIKDSGKYKGDRRLETTDKSEVLCVLAKELKVPVIVLSQLNRESIKRTNKRPILSDLKETSGIEENAHMVLFLYRGWLHKEEGKTEHDMEVIMGKHREGTMGTVNLKFEGKYSRFYNVEDRNEAF